MNEAFPFYSEVQLAEYFSRRNSLIQTIRQFESSKWYYRGRSADIGTLRNQLAQLDYEAICEGADTCGLGTVAPELYLLGVGGVIRQAAAVTIGEYTLTRTVAGKLAERPFLNSPLTLREIMAAGKPIPDPGGVAGALRWDVPGTFRGSAGTWELVIDPRSNTVLHWLFKSAP